MFSFPRQIPVSIISEKEQSDCEIKSRSIFPSDANPSIKKWNEPHHISVPDSKDRSSEKLWVFLPGTGATPDYYTLLNNEAVKTGLHAICLRYPNDESVNIQICPYDWDNDCHEKLRKEIVTGENVFDHVEVDRDNSIEGRLRNLLQYLRDTYSEEEWGQYLDQQDQIVWSTIVISGHSQGAGHAMYIAKHENGEPIYKDTWHHLFNPDGYESTSPSKNKM